MSGGVEQVGGLEEEVIARQAIDPGDESADFSEIDSALPECVLSIELPRTLPFR